MLNTDMENKKKFALWAHDETFEKVEHLYRGDNCRSRSEFIEKAILFYCGYLTSENYNEYFPNVIVSILKGMLDLFENRMASLLFKMAVEISMSMHVTAATNEIDEETLSRLRAMCVNEVKKIHGCICFDDAVEFQRG